MAFKIYTKTGDEGSTGLIGGTRIPKNHIRIEAYGTVDELNSWLGVVADQVNHPDSVELLKSIQDRLFVVGSALACDPKKENKMTIPDLHDEDITALEKAIDTMNMDLPQLQNFVLPGGHIVASQCHIARCVCRRAERICVDMKQQNEFVANVVLIYLNRLSDYLFVLARYILMLEKGKETIWRTR